MLTILEEQDITLAKLVESYEIKINTQAELPPVQEKSNSEIQNTVLKQLEEPEISPQTSILLNVSIKTFTGEDGTNK